MAHRGASSDGLSTTALPLISAGHDFHAGMAMGKFHGVIAPIDAERRAQRVHEDAVAFGGDDASVQPRALATVVAEDVDGPADFALRLGQRLAFLARHLAGDGVGARLEQVGRAEQHVAALRCRHGGPRRLCSPRRRDGGRDIVGRRLGERPDEVVHVGRVAILERAARSRGRPTGRR